MTSVAPFLLPPGYGPPPVAAILREGAMVMEFGRYVARVAADRRQSRPYAGRAASRGADPVLLVPGFLAGDATLALLGRTLRADGLRTYRSRMQVNAGCTLDATAQLEERLEAIRLRRGRRVQVVGHSLGGMLARGLAARRPDLVSRIVTLGSPILAPGAHHASLSAGVEVLVRLSRAGVGGLMSDECVAGDCARESFTWTREPLAATVDHVSIWSRHDGIVDFRACRDPESTQVEVTCSHVGMAVDPRVHDEVLAALRRPTHRISVGRVESA